MKISFKDIPGYEGLYMVSKCGLVKSLPRKIRLSWGGEYYTKERILIPAFVNGYPKVLLYKNGSRLMLHVHRLVALTYIPVVPGKPHINHINSNRSDPRVENLEWCTQKENANHSFSSGNRKPIIITQERKNKIALSKYKKVVDVESGVEYTSLSNAANKIGMPISTLSVMLNGKTKNKTSLRYA